GSAPGEPSAPRLLLLVQTTYTLPVRGLASTSSGRSIGVAPTLSAAIRVKTSTSSVDIPGTTDSPSRVSGSHSPTPRLLLSGSCSPSNLATYRSPSVSRSAFRRPPRGSYFRLATNLYR